MVDQLRHDHSVEVVFVDDGSTDTTYAALQKITADQTNMRIVQHPVNRGLGAAIRTGLARATGDIVLIQDADLEYDPREYTRMLRPLLEGKADAVFGSRFMVAGERRVLYFWHSVANQILT